MKTQNVRNLEQYIDFHVVDKTGREVGTLDCLWSDHTGQAAFLGVRTGWFMGKTHVVPAHGAELNTAARAIRLPYDAQKIKDAPAYSGDATLDERTEREVYQYYNIQMQQAQAAPQGRSQEEARVQLSEEELKVGKRQVEYGGVRLRKIVRTETVTQPVELQR